MNTKYRCAGALAQGVRQPGLLESEAQGTLPGSPVVLFDREVPEPETIFLVPVGRWSDGTAEPIL
jgi:hypothetical protein